MTIRIQHGRAPADASRRRCRLASTWDQPPLEAPAIRCRERNDAQRRQGVAFAHRMAQTKLDYFNAHSFVRLTKTTT
jgi:hypothetical protein